LARRPSSRGFGAGGRSSPLLQGPLWRGRKKGAGTGPRAAARPAGKMLFIGGGGNRFWVLNRGSFVPLRGGEHRLTPGQEKNTDLGCIGKLAHPARPGHRPPSRFGRFEGDSPRGGGGERKVFLAARRGKAIRNRISPRARHIFRAAARETMLRAGPASAPGNLVARAQTRIRRRTKARSRVLPFSGRGH